MNVFGLYMNAIGNCARPPTFPFNFCLITLFDQMKYLHSSGNEWVEMIVREHENCHPINHSTKHKRNSSDGWCMPRCIHGQHNVYHGRCRDFVCNYFVHKNVTNRNIFANWSSLCSNQIENEVILSWMRSNTNTNAKFWYTRNVHSASITWMFLFCRLPSSRFEQKNKYLLGAIVEA